MQDKNWSDITKESIEYMLYKDECDKKRLLNHSNLVFLRHPFYFTYYKKIILAETNTEKNVRYCR